MKALQLEKPEHWRTIDIPEPSAPATGESLPVVGLGTSGVFDVGPDPAKRAPLQEVLDILLSSGGALLDTSPMYGRAEQVAGDLIAAQQLRPRMFIATKVWTKGRAEGLAQIEAKLCQALQRVV